MDVERRRFAGFQHGDKHFGSRRVRAIDHEIVGVSWKSIANGLGGVENVSSHSNSPMILYV
jgi:hypothetical protein